MTRASFRRSKALADAGNDVSILTFNIEPDLAQLLKPLRTFGELGETPVLNMHTELCRNGVELARQSTSLYGLDQTKDALRSTSHLVKDVQETTSDSQDFSINSWFDNNGVLLRIDLHDRENRLFLVEERKAHTENPRRLTLFRPGTDQVLLQGGSHAFQKFWVHSLVEDCPLVALVIDGVAPNEALATFSLPNVLKFSVQHSIHTVRGEDAASGKLEPRLISPLRSNRTFDGITAATESQAHDIRKRIDPVCRVRAIPNANAQPEQGVLERDPNLCVVVSRIEETNKRISHLLRAIASARQKNPKIRAEFYGGPLQGRDWGNLSALVRELGLDEAITFYGHLEDASESFSRAGFTALTSRFEGQSLTLVEAMSRGAVPISYDIEYGPGEIIEEGCTGFLIEDGDIESLSDRMLMLANNNATVNAMRIAAQVSAERFSSDEVGLAWLSLCDEAVVSLPTRNRLRAVKARVVRVQQMRNRSVRLVCDFELAMSRHERSELHLALQAVNHHNLLSQRIEAHAIRTNRSNVRALFKIKPHDLDALGERDVTAWLRVALGDAATDVRIQWDPTWGAWPTRSSSGTLNLR